MPKKQEQILSIQQAIDLGEKYLSAGVLDKAETIYQQILQVDPKHPVALHLLGVIAHQVGKYDTAVDFMTNALSIKPDFAEAHSNLGLSFKECGKLDEAIASFNAAISIKSNFAEAHYNLGITLQERGQLDGAVWNYNKALIIKPDYADVHYNLGIALRELGKLEEAVNCFKKSIAAKAEYAEAHSNLGLVFQELGKSEEAVASFNRAITIKPNFAEAHNNLGVTFLELGWFSEAAASYDKALVFKPDYAVAHNNLGNMFQEMGRHNDAFIHHRRAIKLNPENSIIWFGLANSLRSFSFTSIDNDLLEDLLTLLYQPTVRPSDLTDSVISALNHHVEFSKTLTLAGADKPEASLDFHITAAQLSNIPLFLHLISLTHIPDLRVERMLTCLRCLMLDEAIAGNIKDQAMPFASALALQCFTNEYTFFETDKEKLSIKRLQKKISELLEQNQEVSPSLIITLASYRPLYKFEWSKKLGEHEWNEEVSAVIERQILEPFTELSLLPQIVCLTPLDDSISQSVRNQYEENPYPRWVKTGLVEKRRSIGDVLKTTPLRFDLGDYETPNNPEILIAGCGTGQHSLVTASRFKDASVLAIDLSLNSLSYAVRKANELGVTNIDYRQADIMELGSLDRQFDLIESAGVLHHLGDPMAGWNVLVDLLRPGGLMSIGLYSEMARQHIVAGRSIISEMGYTSSVEDIREFRQDIIKRIASGKIILEKIIKMRDFFSISECRDLLFHVQEYRFTIPQIGEALELLDLKFLGFEFKDQSVMKNFKDIYPQKCSQISLALWHEFEQQHPDTFIEMYKFWCVK